MSPTEGGNPEPNAKFQAGIWLSKFLVLEARPEETLRWARPFLRHVITLQTHPGNLPYADLPDALCPWPFALKNAWILLRNFLKDFSLPAPTPVSAVYMISSPSIAPSVRAEWVNL